jgi:hypothetical protein
LREQLVKVLEHQVKIGSVDSLLIHQGATADAETATDLNASPFAIASWLLEQPTSAVSWANDVLFAVCVEDAPKWRGSALERGLLERLLPAGHWQAITGDGAAKRARAMVASRRMSEYAEGILTASQLLGL